MKKNFLIILNKYSNDPIEASLSRDDFEEGRFTICCDNCPEGQLIAQVRAENFYSAIDIAIELRDTTIGNGKWEIIENNNKNAFW